MKLKIATVLAILSMVVGGLYTQDTLYERKAHAAATEKRIWIELERTNINQEILAVSIMLNDTKDDVFNIKKEHGIEPKMFPPIIFDRYFELLEMQKSLEERYKILYKIKVKKEFGE